MTFRHKLARRLALIRSESPRTAMLAAAILLGGCLDQAASTAFDPGAAEDPTGTKEAVALSIAPASLTLEIDQRAQFKATGDVEWVVNGGAISKEGVFASKSAGTFKVIGRHRGRPHWRDTSVVVVVPTPPELAGIAVAPATASVPTGGSLTFSAIGELGDGTPVAVGVTWSATGGSIDAGGNYSAGSTTGTYHVIARHSGGEADTAAVLITKAEIVPAPNEPAPAPAPSYPAPTGGTVDFTRPAGALPTTPAELVALGIIPPTLTAAQSASMGSMFATYESRWLQFGESHWNAPADGYTNYYDRAYSFYALWIRTGDEKWRQRAHTIAVNYRTSYLEANSYHSSPHWAQLEGLFLHYWLTGDTQSRRAVIETARYLLAGFPVERSADPNYQYAEGRIQQRVLLGALLACKLGDTSVDWCGKADQFITNWLATQQADGGFRYRLETEMTPCTTSVTSNCSPMGQNNFMEGLRADAAIKYYHMRRQDPRVITLVSRMADYMTTQFNATSGVFKYYSVHNDADPRLADLNHMIVPMFGFAYKTTGRTQYRTLGDAAFDAGEPTWTDAYRAVGAGEFLGGSKQFNEHYYNSYQYLAYRQ